VYDQPDSFVTSSPPLHILSPNVNISSLRSRSPLRVLVDNKNTIRAISSRIKQFKKRISLNDVTYQKDKQEHEFKNAKDKLRGPKFRVHCPQLFKPKVKRY